VENFSLSVAAAPMGAAFAGACTPWTSLSAVGTNHVRTQSAVRPAAGTPDVRRVAVRQIPALTNRKQNNVLKTRMNGGGYGAMGPHPEREPV
jgi:hypothetical protein